MPSASSIPAQPNRAVASTPSFSWDVRETALGPILAATTAEGLAGFFFVGETPRERALAELQALWPGSAWSHEPRALDLVFAAVDDYANASGPAAMDKALRRIAIVWAIQPASPFRRAVWEGLRAIPAGRPVSYSELAGRLGRPAAVRAVASAVASNPLGLFIPCHRVIRSGGEIGQFRGGSAVKRRLLEHEGWRSRPAPFSASAATADLFPTLGLA